jgi:hypothetical protein
MLRQRQQTSGAEHGLTLERLAEAERQARRYQEEALKYSNELADARESLVHYLLQCSDRNPRMSRGPIGVRAESATGDAPPWPRYDG